MDIAGARPTSKRAWEAIQATLAANDVRLISPQEVAFAQGRGAGTLLLDCRPPAEYAAGHIPGAVSIPLYRPITGLSPRAVARRAVFALFGVLNGTEANPAFWPAVAAAASKAAEVIVYCNTGGTLRATPTNQAGQQSRSLSAAFEVVAAMEEEGYTSDGGTPSFLGLPFGGGGGRRPKVSVLKGGFYEWKKGGRPVEAGGPAVSE
jgi:rhodanese-related sulfurtransferase